MVSDSHGLRSQLLHAAIADDVEPVFNFDNLERKNATRPPFVILNDFSFHCMHDLPSYPSLSSRGSTKSALTASPRDPPADSFRSHTYVSTTVFGLGTVLLLRDTRQ